MQFWFHVFDKIVIISYHWRHKVILSYFLRKLLKVISFKKVKLLNYFFYICVPSRVWNLRKWNLFNLLWTLICLLYLLRSITYLSWIFILFVAMQINQALWSISIRIFHVVTIIEIISVIHIWIFNFSHI